MEINTAEIAQNLVKRIRFNVTRPINLIEFCGGHTVAIMRNGIRQLLPPEIRMSSGPGCPVCVTSAGDIDKIIQLARCPGVITATFGDLLRVPGSRSSLQQSRAEGCDIRVVYSALEAVDIARQNPGHRIAMVGIGFETTAPTIAASLVQAGQEGLRNYFILSLHKLTPPATRAILSAGEIRLDGIICPGHVSAIIGSRLYEPVVRDFGVACVVTGFEPLDILQGVEMLTRQIKAQKPEVEIAYKRVVKPEGNPVALKLMEDVFDIVAVDWRGFGTVRDSGLKLKSAFHDFDAEAVFNLPAVEAPEPAGCLCGAVLRGVKSPADCSLFGAGCTPEYPVGPCMVSSEGTCSAYYLYGDING